MRQRSSVLIVDDGAASGRLVYYVMVDSRDDRAGAIRVQRRLDSTTVEARVTVGYSAHMRRRLLHEVQELGRARRITRAECRAARKALRRAWRDAA